MRDIFETQPFRESIHFLQNLILLKWLIRFDKCIAGKVEFYIIIGFSCNFSLPLGVFLIYPFLQKWIKLKKLSFIILITFLFTTDYAIARIDDNKNSSPGKENKDCTCECDKAQQEQPSMLQLDSESTKEPRNSKNDDDLENSSVSSLSFNFIYYIIYKFKYIEDIFGLNESGKEEAATPKTDWHWELSIDYQVATFPLIL